MASDILKDVVDATFQKEVMESNLPVLVDFWATWCGPCKALTPTLEGLAKTYEGKIKIVKFNVEDSTDVPQNYAVTALPTLLFFKGGAVAESMVGGINKTKLEDTIKRVIG